mgnify:CR=1 FL=1
MKNEDFMLQVFAYMESILRTKQNLMEIDGERFYIQARHVIFRGLSNHRDLVPVINLLNTRNMEPRMEYEFLLNFVPAANRKNQKWFKKTAQSLYLKSVQEYYGYNEVKATQAMKLLSVEQLSMIEERIRKVDSWTYSKDMESK